jgi:Fe-S cluster assembly protein SufB
MNDLKDFNNLTREVLDKANNSKILFQAKAGIDEELVREISRQKNEPDWMLEKRLKAFEFFKNTEMPSFGPNLSDLNLDEIVYYVTPDALEATSWDDVPEDIKQTFEKLGIPEAERTVLAGVGAQYDSSVVYHNLEKALKDKGVIFENMDVAVQKYPELVKKYFMTECVAINDHKFVMLHASVWSGGTFIYVPKGVKVELPLQAYFRMNSPSAGQFEHTLIIADEGAEIEYIEGCSAPKYSKNSLHAGCVELFVHKNAKISYYSIENWSKNTYNLNTKRALVDESGEVKWINGNMGSGVTMLYPCSVLRGENAKSDSLGIAYAGAGQNQDAGVKVIHVASNTKSIISSKSISANGGISSYRGFVKVTEKAENSKIAVECDALLLDEKSVSNTYPTLSIQNDEVEIAHEAKVGSIGEEEIFYLKSRGLSEEGAKKVIVSGFIDKIVKALPLEYALELNKLIELEMENSVG